MIFKKIAIVNLTEVQITPFLASSGSLFQLTPGSFDTMSVVSDNFLAFWYKKIFRAHPEHSEYV